MAAAERAHHLYSTRLSLNARSHPILPALATLLLALTGCGAEGPADPRQADPPPARVRLIAGDRARSASELPPGCSLAEVKEAFTEMLSGADAGDRSRTLSRIAAPPELTAFVLGPASRSPTGDAADERTRYRRPDGIWRYFARQSSRGYSRHLLDAQVDEISPGTGKGAGPFRRPATGPAADDPVVAIGFTVGVAGDDGSEFTLSGKAGLNCTSGRFYFYGGG